MAENAGLRARIRVQDALADGLEATLLAIADAIKTRLSAVLGSDVNTQDFGTLEALEARLASIKALDGNAEATRLGLLTLTTAEIGDYIDALGLDEARAQYFAGYRKLADAAAESLRAAGIIDVDSLLDRDGIRLAVEAFAGRQDDLLFGGIRRITAERLGEALQANAELLTDVQFSERLADTVRGTVPQLKTEAITRLAQADRFVHEQVVREAERDGDEFLRGYAGPLDKVTRPFCRHMVNKAFTLAELEHANNAQIGAVIDTGGGYRCRHMFEAVPADMLEEFGFTRGTPRDIATANAAARKGRRAA